MGGVAWDSRGWSVCMEGPGRHADRKTAQKAVIAAGNRRGMMMQWYGKGRLL